MSRATLDAWVSTVARIIGLALLLAFGVSWLITQRSEPILIGAALTLYGVGILGRARILLEDESPTVAEPPSVPAASDQRPGAE